MQERCVAVLPTATAERAHGLGKPLEVLRDPKDGLERTVPRGSKYPKSEGSGFKY